MVRAWIFNYRKELRGECPAEGTHTTKGENICYPSYHIPDRSCTYLRGYNTERHTART